MLNPSDALIDPVTPAVEERRPYTRPAIVDELQLETRAGSPIGLLPTLKNPFDPGTRF